MIKTITNIDDYIKSCDVETLPINYDDKMEVELFGKKLLLENDPWMWHLHLKVTDMCNANCNFCVEQNSPCKNNECDVDTYIKQVSRMLTEMDKNHILYSVSVTGGEPLLYKGFERLCDVLYSHPISFLTLNTNASFLEQCLILVDGLFDVVDISRHAIADTENNEVFGSQMISIDDLKRIKDKLKSTDMRIQCVMDKVNSVEKMLKFIDEFSFADDISFRKLMKLGDEYGISYKNDDLIYEKVLGYAYDHWDFWEQTIQDYYVYEVWNTGKTDVTFSYSNMKMLREVEEKEPKEICREFIIHPNGIISGSWNPNEKVILRP